MSKTLDTTEHKARMRDPLRQVVLRVERNAGHPLYQDETLECGHIVRGTPQWRRTSAWAGEWFWPQRRRCWQCGQEVRRGE